MAPPQWTTIIKPLEKNFLCPQFPELSVNFERKVCHHFCENKNFYLLKSLFFKFSNKNVLWIITDSYQEKKNKSTFKYFHCPQNFVIWDKPKVKANSLIFPLTIIILSIQTFTSLQGNSLLVETEWGQWPGKWVTERRLWKIFLVSLWGRKFHFFSRSTYTHFFHSKIWIPMDVVS